MRLISSGSEVTVPPSVVMAEMLASCSLFSFRKALTVDEELRAQSLPCWNGPWPAEPVRPHKLWGGRRQGREPFWDHLLQVGQGVRAFHTLLQIKNQQVVPAGSVLRFNQFSGKHLELYEVFVRDHLRL